MMISFETYLCEEIPERDVLGIVDFTDAEVEAVRRIEPSKEAEVFNGELGFRGSL